jgi:hypothetical protein
MHKLLFSGFSILFVAVVVNLVVSYFGISTWYSFLSSIEQRGLIGSLAQLKFFSILFLFLIYPFILGLTAYISLSFFKK